MVVKNGTETNLTIGSAAMQCALESGKLVSFNSCQSMESVVEDLKNYDGIANAKFWIGLFAPGVDNKQRGRRNFLSDGEDWIIDSYV